MKPHHLIFAGLLLACCMIGLHAAGATLGITFHPHVEYFGLKHPLVAFLAYLFSSLSVFFFFAMTIYFYLSIDRLWSSRAIQSRWIKVLLGGAMVAGFVVSGAIVLTRVPRFLPWVDPFHEAIAQGDAMFQSLPVYVTVVVCTWLLYRHNYVFGFDFWGLDKTRGQKRSTTPP